MTRNCFHCAHGLTCFARIEFTRTIQSFKLLAENEIERVNTNATHTVEDIHNTLAGACSAFERKTDD